MDLKRWTLLVAMIGVLVVTAFANGRIEERNDREDRFKERRAFFKENIKPKVDAQRVKLDETISQDDKGEIERLRKEIISQKLLENEFLFEARAMRIKGEEVSEDLILEIKTQRIMIENLHDEAKIIANKYRPEIDDLLAELKEDRAEWRDEMRQEKGGRKGKGGRQMNDGRARGGDHHPGMRGMGPGEHGKGQFGLVTFLLWDVNRG